MNLFKVLIGLVIALVVGIIKTLKFIPINIKKTFSLKIYKERKKKYKKEKRGTKYMPFPIFIFAGLIATIMMIPINLFLCASDSFKENKKAMGFK